MKKHLTKRNIAIVIISLIILFFFIPPQKPLFTPDYSTVVLDEDGKILRVFLNENQQWCMPPDKNLEIPEKLKKAVLSFEDKHFYYHPGVNPIAIVRAAYQNIKNKEVVSGASTITMQVARLSNLKSRTYFNKLIEIIQSIKIELHYSKKSIFSMYLDHAPYGGNIVGYQAASLRYFGKIPAELTWGEACILAVLPNAPGLISPTADKQALKLKRNALLKKLMEEKVIDEETYQLAKLESIPNTSIPFDMAAPHLSQHLKQQHDTPTIKTTINKKIQIRSEELVKTHLEYLNTLGIPNGCAVIAETKTGKVRAYVGSQNFWDNGGLGQVDGVLAPRSSGSLLKPFLYALCMDEGIILPETKIKDIPTYYGTFSPHNADERFSGLVSAKEALVRSLNVPAVRLLYTYDTYRFYHFLKSAKISTLFRTAEDYGLPLIIGGAEVTAWDMAMLFRGLANGGKFRQLQVLADSTDVKGLESTQLISPGACYLTLQILNELKRPGAEFYWEQYQNQWPMAWKTGTSYGQRDAWAVGTTPEWTIAVWVGNFDGEGNANLGGASSAGPLLFDLFNSLPKNSEIAWFEEPLDELELVELCKATGFLATSECSEKIQAKSPWGMKPLKGCPYHKKIYVDKSEKYRVCSLCWESGNYKSMNQLIYPPDLAQALREAGQITYSLPPHNPDCPAQKTGDKLAILYPQENAKLWIPRDIDGSLQKVTMRLAHTDANKRVFWYLDNCFIGETKNYHVKSIHVIVGEHTLEVVDEEGFRDRTKFYTSLKSQSN